MSEYTPTPYPNTTHRVWGTAPGYSGWAGKRVLLGDCTSESSAIRCASFYHNAYDDITVEPINTPQS